MIININQNEIQYKNDEILFIVTIDDDNDVVFTVYNTYNFEILLVQLIMEYNDDDFISKKIFLTNELIDCVHNYYEKQIEKFDIEIDKFREGKI